MIKSLPLTEMSTRCISWG